MARETPNDAALVRVALRQHGSVTRAQLLQAGFNDDGIRYRVGQGRLHRVFRGVYGLGRPPQTALERAAAAVLACGPTAVLSHRPALALWGLATWPASVAEVLVTQDRRTAGIRVHQCRTLLPRDTRTRHGIRVTSPARTLLDNAPQLTDKALTRAVNDARLISGLKPDHLAELLTRCPTHPGASRLKPFAEPGHGPTRSELEDAFVSFCKTFNLPRPKINVKLGNYEVDALFEAEGLIVELDSYTHHSSRDAFEHDRTRDLDAKADRRDTIRITHRQITQQPQRTATRLQQILEDRRRQPRV